MNAPAPASPNVPVIPAEGRHVDEMVACHMAALPGEFTTVLGPPYLRRSHRYLMQQDGGICLVSIDGPTGRVSGFVKGGRPELRDSFTRRHMWRFAGRMVLKSLTHGPFRRRLGHHLGEAVRKVGRKLHVLRSPKGRPAPPEGPPGTWSNLISICVHPEYRGRGIGMALMEAFRAASARRGYATMRLSVHNDNHAAIALYKKAGWRAVLTTPKGTYFTRSVEESK